MPIFGADNQHFAIGIDIQKIHDILVCLDFQIGNVIRLHIFEVDVFSLDLYLVVILS